MSEFDIKITEKGYDGFGWDSFVKRDVSTGEDNPWVRFALDNDIVLQNKEIRVTKKSSPFRRITPAKMIGKYVKFVESPWTKWQRERTLPSIAYKTIENYRRDFPRKRPDWAKSFNERGIKNSSVTGDRNKSEFVIPPEYNTQKSHFIEREIWSGVRTKGGKYIIERVQSDSGRIEMVNVVFIFNSGGPFNLWTNERVSSTNWECSQRYVCDTDWENKRSLQFLRVNMPWSECF